MGKMLSAVRPPGHERAGLFHADCERARDACENGSSRHWRVTSGGLAVEDERYTRGISPPAAVDGGAYGRCVEGVRLKG